MFPTFVSQIVLLHVICKRTLDLVPPVLFEVHSETFSERTFNRITCAGRVPRAGDIIASRRFAFFDATPKHGLRPRTLAWAPAPREHSSGLISGPQPRPRTWPVESASSVFPESKLVCCLISGGASCSTSRATNDPSTPRGSPTQSALVDSACADGN